MTESYKIQSKLATAIGGICTIITTLGVNQLEAMFPDYGKFIPMIVAAATWYVSQTTENKRVEVAEQLVHEQYENDPNEQESVVVNLTLDGQDIISDEDDVDEDVFSDDSSDEELA